MKAQQAYVRFPPKKSLLVIVDIQEKLVAAMPPDAAEACVSNAVRLVNGAAALHIPVLFTEQYPEGLGPTVAPLREALAAHTEVDRVKKTEFDACTNRNFVEHLGRRRNHIVVAGMEAHICVAQTVRGLRALKHTVAVATDATCSRTSENRRIGEGLVSQAGALVTSTEAVLFDWIGGSDNLSFRTISRLVR